MNLPIREFGKTGEEISQLGIGLSEIGRISVQESKNIDKLLNSAIDLGINFFDTAPCYGNSEEFLGRAISHRRSEYFLASKCGHYVESSDDDKNGNSWGESDLREREWTKKTIIESVDRSLKRMKTDYLDLIQLHSCDLDILHEGEVIDAIERMKEAGKVRFIGYSGDNEAAEWASLDSRFDSIQTSFNVLDQGAKNMVFPGVNKTQKGLIAKRPIANGAWGADKSPSAYASEYFRRYEIINSNGIDIDTDLSPIELSLAFALSHQTINVHIVGTTNLSHLKSNIKQVETELLLDEKTLNQLYEVYDQSNDNWVSQT